MATSHFPLKNCILFGLLYTVTKIYHASSQVTQPPPSVYEPPSIPLPRWPQELNRTQNGYHVLPDYVQQQIRQRSEIVHPPPQDSILRSEVQKNPFSPKHPNTNNPHVFKQEASWMQQPRNQYPKDRSTPKQSFNQQGPSKDPAYNNYPYKPQYPNGYTKYEPQGPPFQKSADARPQNSISFDHHTQAKMDQPQNNGYTYPKPPPGYYGPEKKDTKTTAGIPLAILEYLQKQQAKDGLPPTLLNYLHSQAKAPVPQSVQERTTQAPSVESSTKFSHQAHQPNQAADLQPSRQESSTESPTARTTEQPTTPVSEFTTKAAADELMAKLSSQLESQSAAVKQLTDSFTTLSPLDPSATPANSSDALSLQFRKILLKKLIARRLLTLKTIGNLSKNTTTIAPVNISESVTTAPNMQHNSAQEPAIKPNASNGIPGNGTNHQQSLPTIPTFVSHEPKTTETLKDVTTTSSPELLPGERFPPNSHYVGHLPPDAPADPQANRANHPTGYHHSFDAQRPNAYESNRHFGNQQHYPQNAVRNKLPTKTEFASGIPKKSHEQSPNTYEANQHFRNQPQKTSSPQNAPRNSMPAKTASASGIPEISYVHSGQQNYPKGAAPKPDTAAQNSQPYDKPASTQKILGLVTEPSPIFGAPNEMQTIEIPAMNNPTAKPGMVRVVYIPGKNGAKGFFRVIHVSAPETSNPSTVQPLSPIQKYFSQDKLNNQQYPTPEQLRRAIEQEKRIQVHNGPSQTQKTPEVPKRNPAIKLPQKFPAVDATPLTGSQTNVKDSLVGLLNSLEPTKATKGNIPRHNQAKQASNSWTDYASSANGYVPNQTSEKKGRFGPKYPTEQIPKHSDLRPQRVNNIQEPHQQYPKFTNFHQDNKRQGPEMRPSSSNLDPYYKLVEEQIRQNSIFTTTTPPNPTTSQPIQSQFGYNNAHYGAHGAPWETHYKSNRNKQHNHQELFRQNSILTTTASPTTTSQVNHGQFGYNNVQSPWERHHMANGKQYNRGVIDSRGPTTEAPQVTTTSQQNRAQFGYNHVPYGAPWERHHMFSGKQQNHGVIDSRGSFNYPSRTHGPVVMTTEQPTTSVPMQTFGTKDRFSAHNSNEFNMANQQPKGPAPTGVRMQSELTGAVRGASASVNVPGKPVFHGEHTQHTGIVGASSNLGLKDLTASIGQGAKTDVVIQDQLVQQTMMELLKVQPHLLQGNNLQELIRKLSQNISVPLIDRLSVSSPTAVATGSSSPQSNGGSIASPGVGHQRYPESKAAPLENQQKTQSPSSHQAPTQWNPVNANAAQNAHSSHHRNMNQYQREMHMDAYHYQRKEVPTTTALPTTSQSLSSNFHNQNQYSGRYEPQGPHSRYPIRGPQQNFPIPIYEHTVLEKPKPQPKPQQSKPVVQTPPVQHQNYWQQQPQTANNQQQNQSSGQHNNHWQQQQNQHRYQQQQYRGSPQQNPNAWQQQSNQTNQYQPYRQTQQNHTNPNYWQQYPNNQYQTHANPPPQQYYRVDPQKQIHPQQNNQQAPFQHHGQSRVVEAKPLQVQIPGNINLGAPHSSITAGSYPVAQVQHGQTTSSPLVDTFSLQRSPLVDPVSPSGGVPDLTAGLPKSNILVSFPGGGVRPGADVLGILDPRLLSAGNPRPSTPAPSTSTVAPNTTMAMPIIPTTTIPPAHTFSSEQMCTMQSECEMGCCYTLQGDILWDWQSMMEPPHPPQVGYCHTKTSTKLGDGCEASFCPCVSANQVCLSVPPENFTIPAGYDAAEQGAISFGKCMSRAQKNAAVSHMNQAKMLVDMCMSDPSCPLHSMQLQKKKKK